MTKSSCSVFYMTIILLCHHIPFFPATLSNNTYMSQLSNLIYCSNLTPSYKRESQNYVDIIK